MKKYLYVFLFSLCFISLSFSQSVTTITDQSLEDGIALDSNGNLYVTHFYGNSVYKITPDGDVSQFITGFSNPNGLAFDSNDNLFVCDWTANAIYKYNSSGSLLNSYPVTGNPSGIMKAYDNDDMIFSHYTSNMLSRLSSTGVITTISSESELNGPVGLTFDDLGVMYVGNYNNRTIYRVIPDGTLEYVAQLPSSGGSLPNLGYMTYAGGSLFATVLSEHKIFSINPNGVDDYSVFAGSIMGNTDGDISTATFNMPNGIKFNSDEDVMYITDFGSKNLRIITGISLLSIDKFNAHNLTIKVYTNPNKDELHIKTEISNGRNFIVKINDLNGKELLKSEGFLDEIDNTIVLDIGDLSSGSYLVSFISESQSIIKKIILN